MWNRDGSQLHGSLMRPHDCESNPLKSRANKRSKHVRAYLAWFTRARRFGNEKNFWLCLQFAHKNEIHYVSSARMTNFFRMNHPIACFNHKLGPFHCDSSGYNCLLNHLSKHIHFSMHESFWVLLHQSLPCKCGINPTGCWVFRPVILKS